MSDVAAIVDRIFRDYLHNPADLPSQAQVGGIVNDSQLTITYAAELEAEEIDAISVGSMLEMGLERMRVTVHDEATRTLTVTRALYGSEAVEHDATTLIYFSPRWSRLTVFEAVCDEIVALYPEVYATGVTTSLPADLTIELNEADNPVAVLAANQWLGGEFVDVEASVVRSEDFGSGVGVQLVPRANNNVTIRYSREFPRPVAESDLLADLGVEESWHRIILFGVLSGLFAGTDIDAATQDFITESLEAQGFPAGTGVSISLTMERLRANEITKAANRLIARDGVATSYRREL